MKSAEEWWDDHLPAGIALTPTELKGGRDVIGWAKEIQLDAWKQGMTDAAKLAEDSISDLNFVFVPNIIHARDSKTQI